MSQDLFLQIFCLMIVGQYLIERSIRAWHGDDLE